jgi:hypothetical protein
MLETILINKQRRNYIAGFNLLNHNYATVDIYANGSSCIAYTFNIVAIDKTNFNEIQTLIYSDSLKDAIKRTEKIIELTPDFNYCYDDVLSKKGHWYKKRRKELNDNREYKQIYLDLLIILNSLNYETT